MPFRDVVQRLTDMGYERVPQVSDVAQFAVRGGILDLFAWQAAKPLRLEFFDTDLESIREFDLDSQTSTAKLLESDLLLAEPSSEATVADYRRKTDLIISFGAEIEKPDVRILEGAAEFNSEEDDTLACYGSPLGTFEAGDFVLEETRRENFFRQLNDWKRGGWDIAMVFGNRGEEERFAELAGKDLQRDLGLIPVRGELLAGFTVPVSKLALLSSSELFGRYRTPGGPRRSLLEKARAARARARRPRPGAGAPGPRRCRRWCLQSRGQRGGAPGRGGRGGAQGRSAVGRRAAALLVLDQDKEQKSCEKQQRRRPS